MAIIMYGMRLQDSNEYRYVGKTVNLAKRVWSHQSKARQGSTLPVHNWMRKHVGNIQFDTLKKATEENWEEVEIDLIASYRSKGHRLLNVSPGGNSGSNLKGEEVSTAKATWAIVKKIRAGTQSFAEMVKLYGLSWSAISSIRSNNSWHDPEFVPAPQAPYLHLSNLVRQDYDSGLHTYKSLELKYGISKSPIRQILNRIPPYHEGPICSYESLTSSQRKRGSTTFTDDEVRALRKRKKEFGLTYKQLMSEYGISKGLVRVIITKKAPYDFD